MGIGPAIFQSVGQRSEHYVPGAYSRSAAIGGVSGGVTANNGVVLARSKGGQPRKLFTFTTLDEARETLIDGDLLKAVGHAFTPSSEYSPQAIRAMVVNGNSQGMATLKSGALEVIKLKTSSWGVFANSIARQIVNGTNPGTKKILFSAGELEGKIDNIGKKSIQLEYIGDGDSAVLDVNNIGLSVEVYKEEDRPSIDIDGLSKLRVGEAKEFTVATTNPEAEDITIVAKIDVKGIDPSLYSVEFFEEAEGLDEWQPLDISTPFKGPDGFPLTNGNVRLRFTPLAGSEGAVIEYQITLYQVIGGVQTSNIIAQTTVGQAEIAAAGKPYSVYNVPAYDVESGSLYIPFEGFPTIEEIVKRLNGTGDFVAVQLEEEANVPSTELDFVESVSLMGQTVLTSNFYALFHALETSEWIGRENVEKVDGAPNVMPNNDPDPVFFEGASAGSYVVEDWVKALAALEPENIQAITTPVTDYPVHILISNHCTSMSNVQNRKERTAFVGGKIGETIEEALERAKGLNGKLVSYVYPWIIAPSPLTGGAERLPASYFACKLLGMECSVAVNEPLTNKTVGVFEFGVHLKTSEMERLICGGVLCGGETDDGRLAVIRAMTTHQGNQLQLCERSMVREDLIMNRDIRNQLSRGVGRPGLDKGAGGDAEQTLLTAAVEWKEQGLIIPTDEGQNIWSVAIKKSGDKTYLAFNRNLTAPQNFFFVTAKNYIYESATTYEV